MLIKGRKFNGELYQNEGYATTKVEAERRKKKLQDQGFKVRIVKQKGTTVIGATSKAYGKTNYFIYAKAK